MEIEAPAKRRLADEYDAAQQRGDVAANKQRGKAVPDGNSLANVSDLGLTHKQVHEAWQPRDAEAASPGVIRRTLDARLADGEEHNKAVVRTTSAAHSTAALWSGTVPHRRAYLSV